MNTVLDSLFPPGAATVLSMAAVEAGELTPVELGFTTTFAPVRLAEFRHGRACARLALERLGVGAHDIPVGASREPVWPTGVVGSISHAGTAAAAVVAWETTVLSVGVDLEAATPLEAGLMTRICLPEELARMAASRYGAGVAAKLAFSMKEAAYKALWPVLRRFLDFHDIEVGVDEARCAFSVMSRTGRCPAGLAARVDGRFTRIGELFAAGAAVR